MNIYVVLDVREWILDRVFVDLDITYILLNLLFGHLWDRDQEIGEQFELCLELVFFTHLVGGRI
jgi:hypothetical protein